MKAENFLIVDSIAVGFEDSYIDLHNNYDFSGLVYNVETQQVELKWTRSQGKWAKKEKYNKLKLVFDFVSVFSISSRDAEQPFSNDDCLSYIGYLHPDDIELMEGFLPPESADDGYHLVLGFESGYVIKLYSEIINLVVCN